MGLEYSKLLASLGCNLLLVSNQKEELERVAFDLTAQHQVQATPYYIDLTTEDAVETLLAYCHDNAIGIDILVNNAGMFFFEELTSENASKALKMTQLHIITPMRLCIAFGEEMKKRGVGYILNMSSMAAQLPCPGITTYSATKAFLKSFGKSLYFEMRPYGVGVTTVCPGAIATPLYRLKPNLLNFGVKIGLIGTPQWLVRKAIKGMLRKKRVVKPGLMNYYLPPLIAVLPKKIVVRLWKKFK